MNTVQPSFLEIISVFESGLINIATGDRRNHQMTEKLVFIHPKVEFGYLAPNLKALLENRTEVRCWKFASSSSSLLVLLVFLSYDVLFSSNHYLLIVHLDKNHSDSRNSTQPLLARVCLCPRYCSSSS